ncbi:MAG: hypothetical protein R2711_10400 [Acidimicrobiales bacterium]
MAATPAGTRHHGGGDRGGSWHRLLRRADPAACLLPWPNDRFTRADPSTSTGRRLDLPADGMPANVEGAPIDPAEWDRNDGFAGVVAHHGGARRRSGGRACRP